MTIMTLPAPASFDRGRSPARFLLIRSIVANACLANCDEGVANGDGIALPDN